ncbi:MAG: membrane-bound serine protease (ClpP class) [Verrucomicrobia bacterium]|nr:MAG: membrane-bound serine protease (ClpP class) [Verrucomicrobiota bacterium]
MLRQKSLEKAAIPTPQSTIPMPTQDLTILLLFVAGLGLFWVEMYVPGGVIGAVGILAVLVGISLAFACHGVAVGAATSAAVLTITILMMRHWMHHFRSSFFGSRMTNRATAGQNDYVEATRTLVGQKGITVCRLQPGGKAQFGDQRLDVISQLETVEPGCAVEIVKVDGIAIVVRPIPPANGV